MKEKDFNKVKVALANIGSVAVSSHEKEVRLVEKAGELLMSRFLKLQVA